MTIVKSYMYENSQGKKAVFNIATFALAHILICIYSFTTSLGTLILQFTKIKTFPLYLFTNKLYVDLTFFVGGADVGSSGSCTSLL